MTAIFGFAPRNVPVLIGDVLISGPERSDQEVLVPTIGEISDIFPRGSGYTITGLSQKIAILSENAVVAWSGRRIVATVAIRELKEIAESGRLTPETFHKFMCNIYRTEGQDSLSILGFIKNNKKQFTPITTDYRFRVDRNLGPYFWAGSGGEDLYRHLMKITNTGTLFERQGMSDNHPYGLFVLFAQMIDYELLMPTNLYNYYGGAYELAWSVNNRFQKIDDITLAVWDIVKEDEGAHLKIPHRIFKFARKDNILYIRTLYHEKEEERTQEMKQAIYAIGGVDQPSSIEDIASHELPKFNSKINVHLFRIVNENGQIEKYNMRVENDISENFLDYEEIETGVVITATPNMIKPIFNRL